MGSSRADVPTERVPTLTRERPPEECSISRACSVLGLTLLRLPSGPDCEVGNWTENCFPQLSPEGDEFHTPEPGQGWARRAGGCTVPS